MKKVILLFILSVSFIGQAQDFDFEDETSSLEWLTDIEEAQQASLNSNKPILIYFTGSDWCSPCKMLKKSFFNTEAFQEKADQFVLLMIDIPRRTDIITPEQKVKNLKVVSKYNSTGGYPNLVALNDNLNIIGELSGFFGETDRHFAFIESILENY